MVRDYLAGRLPACVAGGYDLVDVRDVAQGCLLALEKGKKGECYILSNQFCSVKNVLELVRHEVGGRRLAVMPMWLAAGGTLFAAAARRRHQRPLYTAYSLYTLRSNGLFCHEKAAKELGYRPRPLAQTVRDTALWLQERAGAAPPPPGAGLTDGPFGLGREKGPARSIDTKRGRCKIAAEKICTKSAFEAGGKSQFQRRVALSKNCFLQQPFGVFQGSQTADSWIWTVKK